MRIHIAMTLAAALAVSPVPTLAQANNAADTAATNIVAPAPADANMMVQDANMMGTDMAPPTDTAAAEDASAMPAPAPKSRPFPWGVIGLVGLVGLLGRKRG